MGNYLKSRKIKIDHPLVEEARFYKEKGKLSIHIAFRKSEVFIRFDESDAYLSVPFKVEQIDFEIKP